MDLKCAGSGSGRLVGEGRGEKNVEECEAIVIYGRFTKLQPRFLGALGARVCVMQPVQKVLTSLLSL